MRIEDRGGQVEERRAFISIHGPTIFSARIFTTIGTKLMIRLVKYRPLLLGEVGPWGSRWLVYTWKGLSDALKEVVQFSWLTCLCTGSHWGLLSCWV